MPDPFAQQIVRRFRALEGARKGYWDDKWQQIADHVVGRRDFLTGRSPGERREIALYDTTGRNMVNLLAGGLHSLLVNPSTDWFDLVTPDPALMQDHEVRMWLEDVERILYGIFHAPEARFTAQMDEVFLDLVTFGTGVMFVGDPPGREVLFSARPLSEIFVAENAYGVIDTVFRSFKLTARQVVRQWRESAPEAARKAMERGETEHPIELLHAVYPTDDSPKQGFARMAMSFESVFVSIQDSTLIGRPGGFHELPYLVSRWRVDGGEVYGRGPGDDALAGQKMASSMTKTALQAAQMAVAPPFLTEDDSSIVQLDLRPFGRNVVRSSGLLNPPIQPLDVKATNQIGIEMLRDTRRQIEEAFHFELLKLIQNRGLTPMTAQQVRAIRSSVERLLSPILGRQHSELLGPLIQRVYGIAIRRGLIPPAPPILQGQRFEVEYVSPITRAQREGEVEAVTQWITNLIGAAQSDPSLLDLADMDEAFRFMAAQSAVPAKIVRTPAAVRRIRAAQQQLAKQDDQMEKAGQMAEMMKQLEPGTAPA